MSYRTDLVYLYDGTFDGLLCCVYESYVNKQQPIDILPIDTPQSFLFSTKQIDTVAEHADRIERSLAVKIGLQGKSLIETAFLYAGQEKAFVIYRFICMSYTHGGKVVNMLGDDTVSKLHNMVKAVNNENHLMLGFLRFSEYNGGLVAVFEPKHFILPLMQGHFCSRFHNERFMIYDKTYGMALLYANHRSEIIEVDEIDLPEEEENELHYRRLWAEYYRSIAITERTNPRCRMGHMPKRFWKHMTEMNPQSISRLGEGSGGSLLSGAKRLDTPKRD